ncbi:hypothetical protein [Vibrio campbellii]|uniref:hypothetical protein n=1 Tax=Vibrio campbellii TaxID=680 RepID=UPI002109835D|nr:hypothetical protein [Vibrio campbellii]UTZ44543.1 hypothetical protein HB764_25110 [Vibrio campbellii]
MLVYICLILSGVVLAYNAYIKPELARSDLQILIDRQRELLELKQEYGELIDGDISRQ